VLKFQLKQALSDAPDEGEATSLKTKYDTPEPEMGMKELDDA